MIRVLAYMCCITFALTQCNDLISDKEFLKAVIVNHRTYVNTSLRYIQYRILDYRIATKRVKMNITQPG